MIKKNRKKHVESKKKGKKQSKVIHRLIHRLSTRWGFFLVFAVFFSFFLFGCYVCFTLPSFDDVKATKRTPMVTVYDVNGDKIGVIGQSYGKPIELSRLPPYLVKMLISTEDKRFYAHGGIDVIGILRALSVDLLSRSRRQGASTITAQVAKNLFLSSEKTLMRKIREMFLSVKLEHYFSKDEILEIYFNRMYFGSRIYGIEAAANYYYEKSAYDLSMYESAVLIGMLKAPNTYNPVRNPEKADARAMLVLKTAGMDDNTVKSYPVKRKGNGWFFDFIESEIGEYIGDNSEDIDVYTTFDPVWQMRSEKTVLELMQDTDSEVAVIVMGYDGSVKAMVGGRDYRKSQFNRATMAKRQPGSLFKPFVYVTAFADGYSADDVFRDENDGKISVRNFDRKNRGDVTLSDALVFSLNTVAVKLAEEIGVSRIRKTVKKFGLSADCATSAIIALGVCETTLLNITGAYASIANGGYMNNSYAISRIDGIDGVLYKREVSDATRIVSEDAVKTLSELLADVIRRGTGKKAAVQGLDYKGKTGTSQNGRDAWFVGYDNHVVVGVWTGYDDDRKTKMTGGMLPAVIFRKIMEDN